TVAGLTFSQVLAQETKSGIPLDQSWKETVYAFAANNLQHTAWGLEHSERDYQLARALAAGDGLEIDEDVLFAAAFLHDMAAFVPYAVAGEDHSNTGADEAGTILEPAGFPMNKLPSVQGAIRAHMYYAEVPAEPVAQVLHDADTLNFLGAIGVTRIISLTTREGLAKDLPTAVATLENFSRQLPASLVTATAKAMAADRVQEMESFLAALRNQSADGRAL
ncbi:MAG TPA: metal-dependent phosphohydrolase, partial [Gammaproteobacteria bacterium]|nr:metal-dependent phosphohydrolase [Gammaproteobacteria bacterium]